MWNSEVGWDEAGPSSYAGSRSWPVADGPAGALGTAGMRSGAGRRWLRVVSPSWLLKGLALAALLVVALVYMDDEESPEKVPRAANAPVRMTLGRPNDRLTCFAISPDRRVVATSHDVDQNRVALWSLKDQAARPRLLTFEGPVQSMAFSPDGRFLAIGGERPDVFVVDLAKKRACRVVRTPWPTTKALAFSPRGDRLAISTRNSGEIRVWDLATKDWHVLLKGRGPALNIQFSPDGRSLAAGELDDARVTVWDLATGRSRVLNEQPGGGGVRSVTFSADGRLLATFGYWENVVRLRDAASGQLVRSIGVEGSRPHAVAFAPDGKRIAVGNGHGTIVVQNLETGGVDGRFESLAMSPKLAFSDDGRSLVVAGDDTNELQLWRLDRPAGDQPPGQGRPRTAAAGAPAPRLIAASSRGPA